MKKTVTYRRVANKLRTRNRDLSRHKRCQPMDRSFGNNGSVSSLGVLYNDSDADGYKDKITKIRRAQSLQRAAYKYGTTQNMGETYSRKIASSAAPQTKQTFKSAQLGLLRDIQLEQDYDYERANPYSSALKLTPGFVDSFWYWENTLSSTTWKNPTNSAWKDYTVLEPVVTTNTAVFKITLNEAVAGSITLFFGTEDGRFVTTKYAEPFAGLPGFEAGATSPPKHPYSAEDWEDSATMAASGSSGQTITRTQSGLSPNTTYYWAIRVNGAGANYTIPAGYANAGTGTEGVEKISPTFRFKTLPS